MRLENLIKVIPVTRPFLCRGVKNSQNVLFEFKTASMRSEGESPKRQPFELAIVLDKSGSMKGPSLEYSKAAIELIVSELGVGDTLHLIVYDTNAHVVFQKGKSKQKDALLKKVRGIRSGSQTNLLAGVELARKVLMKTKKKKQASNRRIFLFSDGMVNAGEQSKDVILARMEAMRKEDGINISSFGLGRDFDEDLLEQIARRGEGGYFYIEGAECIQEIVSLGMNALQRLFARNAKLSIVGVNAACVTKVWGFDPDKRIQGCCIGDLCEDDLRTCLVDFEVNVPGARVLLEEDEQEGEDAVEVSPEVAAATWGVEDRGDEVTAPPAAAAAAAATAAIVAAPAASSKGGLAVLQYEFSFEALNFSVGDRIVMKGFVSIPVADEMTEGPEPDNLLVARVIAQTGENDKLTLGLIDRREYAAAIKLKKRTIEELERVLARDDSGMVKKILDRSRVSLRDLKKRKVATARKNCSYTGSWCSSPHRSTLTPSSRTQDD